MRALTDWRRLPFLDPGLPADLLPKGWHGACAAGLFDSIERALHAPAQRHVREVTARQGTTAIP